MVIEQSTFSLIEMLSVSFLIIPLEFEAEIISN